MIFHERNIDYFFIVTHILINLVEEGYNFIGIDNFNDDLSTQKKIN